ncbi:Drug resistance transporter, EmrB/QacA subfamily [Frankia canadensis]|uniref:Drug resistance transporter, EmrB/QacA subfamily n=1 Tax=Frankia canadensis TaxID=1836972 RepID=A0A2I2KJH0_9ACTN|nr:MFS transporter [Frankia canadensis]SNQ45796.1 Drug resistance transporter, EmrB/QacA subfamily [Frankia canadensis]SOU53086.1 Drug resistance transporter, EmrB/QacA subfamily [Frankia canadensis]
MPEPALATLPTTAGGPDRRRWIALVVVCLAMLMNALDSSIVNVALPAIQDDLHFSQSNLTWVVDAYLITFGSFLLLAGRLGDLVGRKKVFLTGVALFTAASALCAAAPDQGTLIAARFLQGLGGAVSSSVIIAIIITEFPHPAERARAMSAYMLVAIGGGSLGLLLGGVLTEGVSWHWIFLINVPIGVATFALGVVLIEERPGLGVGEGVDIAGSLLVTAALVIATYGIVTAATHGWASAHTLGYLAAGIVLLVAFLVVQARRSNPIMPLRVLRIRSLIGSSAVRGCLFIGMNALFFFGVLYLEQVRGYGPLRTGLAFLPMTVVFGALSLGIISRLLIRFGPMKVLLPGLIALLAGLLLLLRLDEHTSYATTMLPPLLIIAFGMGAAAVPLLSLAMADVPRADAGLASGIVNVSMWLTSSIGLAVLSSLAASRTKHLAASGHSAAAAQVGGYHLAFLIGAGCAALALIVALAVLRGPARAALAASRSAAANATATPAAAAARPAATAESTAGAATPAVVQDA